MGDVTARSIDLTRLVLLLVLALAVGAFSYTFGYETGAEQMNDHMGRKFEAIYRSAAFGGDGEDARQAPAGASQQDPAPDPGCRRDCRRGGDDGSPTGSTRDGNRAGGSGSLPPGS